MRLQRVAWRNAVEEVILSCVAEGVDVLPSTISLAGAEVELVNEMARENRLKKCSWQSARPL